MFHINKFQDLGTVSFPLQILRPYGIRDQRCHTLFDQSIFKNRCQHIILYLAVQLMLTAWHRQDHFCIPSYCFRQRKVCRRITRMQCHYHIYRIYSCIVCDISFQKMQFFITIFFT